MRWLALSGYGLSLVIHLGLAGGLTVLPKETRRRATTVTVFEAKPKKEKPPEPPKDEKAPEPPKPIVVPKQALLKAAEPPPAEAPPPTPAAPGHEAMAALPDFGISLGGGVTGGIAIAAGGGAAGPRVGQPASSAERRNRAAPAATAAAGEAPCTEPATKPAYRERDQPKYTDDARAAGIEGRVRVEVTINADGDVVNARLLEGLGHGLDEAALGTMKRAKFRPITRCGKAVAAPAPFVVGVRFGLAD